MLKVFKEKVEEVRIGLSLSIKRNLDFLPGRGLNANHSNFLLNWLHIQVRTQGITMRETQ